MYLLIAGVAGLVVLFVLFGYLIDFRFETRKPVIARVKREYLKGCGPFTVGKRGEAILALHGIAGSPAQLREMCDRLTPEGFVIHAPTLPGHGTDPHDLYGIRWQDWYGSVRNEFDRMQKKYGEVSIVGFSLGAALGLKLASERPVKRLVLMSTPVYLFHSFFPTHYILKLASFVANSARAFPERLPETEDGPEYLIYKSVPFDALNAVVELVAEVKRCIGKVRSPVLVIHSTSDVAAKPRSARFICENIGSRLVKMLWLERVTHGVMHGSDEQKDLIHKELVEFLRD